MNQQWIDLGLCAGLAIVLLASLGIFIAVKVEIAKLRRDLARGGDSTEASRPGEPQSLKSLLETPSEPATPGDTARSGRSPEQSRAAQAYSTALTVEKEDALAVLRRAWNALPQSAESPVQ